MTYVVFPEDERARLLLAFSSAAHPRKSHDLSFAFLRKETCRSSSLQAVRDGDEIFGKVNPHLFRRIKEIPEEYSVLTLASANQPGDRPDHLVVALKFSEVFKLACLPMIELPKSIIAVPPMYIDRTLT